MTHNQFYKNQLYYRAFEGMNPTLNLSEQLLFQSRFQSGNLDCVVKVSEDEYDLFLRIDSNTRGHIEWFYFAVKNCKKGKTVKLNIANLTKGRTHYCRVSSSIIEVRVCILLCTPHARIHGLKTAHRTCASKKKGLDMTSSMIKFQKLDHFTSSRSP